jgi:hypothetical protein
MSLGDLTQLAVQALSSPEKPAKQGEAAPADSLGTAILNQLQAMQRALKEDEELVVLFRHGPETIVVREVYLPTPQLAVLSGIDPNKSTARAIAPVESLQLLCKVAKVPAPAKPSRVALVVPKPRPE